MSVRAASGWSDPAPVPSGKACGNGLATGSWAAGFRLPRTAPAEAGLDESEQAWNVGQSGDKSTHFLGSRILGTQRQLVSTLRPVAGAGA